MKVIAFDLIGVLVKENSFELSETQDKMERLFGKNKSDNEYKDIIRKSISSDINIEDNIKYIINNIYEVKYPNLLKDLKKYYPDILIVIASNHVSYIRDYINKNLDNNLIDNIYISAEINTVKPDSEFYKYILDDLNVNPAEMLFLDDSLENIEGAKTLGINTIKVDKDTNIFNDIVNYIK